MYRLHAPPAPPRPPPGRPDHHHRPAGGRSDGGPCQRENLYIGSQPGQLGLVTSNGTSYYQLNGTTPTNGQVQATEYRPIQPKVTVDVTQPAASRLRSGPRRPRGPAHQPVLAGRLAVYADHRSAHHRLDQHRAQVDRLERGLPVSAADGHHLPGARRRAPASRARSRAVQRDRHDGALVHLSGRTACTTPTPPTRWRPPTSCPRTLFPPRARWSVAPPRSPSPSTPAWRPSRSSGSPSCTPAATVRGPAPT